MPLRKFLAALLTVAILPIGLPAQSAQPAKVTITKAPPETPEQYAARKLALQEMLQRLTTTGRIMQVVAHPDDEDGAMLTLESRVKGNTAMLFTFTRGEGGQNAEGPVFFDELGILRTLELLAADKEYGAEERFSHVADFGFSKTATESFAKWGGEDLPLKDLVEQVREFQPDVLVARFSGTPRDGHGHHVASALMTIKAFHDAADAKRFPERGEQDWQPLRLYTGLAGDEATVVPDEDQPSPLLSGKTPAQVALEGLRFQKSQGLGNIQRNGPRPKIYSSYKLVATADGAPKVEHENDFFDGVDTSLPGLEKRFPEYIPRSYPRERLKDQLGQFQGFVFQAQKNSRRSPSAALPGLASASKVLDSIWASLNPATDMDNPLTWRVQEKLQQIQKAVVIAEGVHVDLAAENATGNFVHPGEMVNFRLTITNGGPNTVPVNWAHGGLMAIFEKRGLTKPDMLELPASIAPKTSLTVNFPRKLSWSAPFDRVPFHRNSPITDTTYTVDGWPQDRNNLSLPEPRSQWFSTFLIQGVRCDIDAYARSSGLPIFVAPALSLAVAPATLLRRLNQPHEAAAKAVVKNNNESAISGTVALNLPKIWASEPARANLTVAAGKTGDENFTIHWPTGARQIQSTIKASFTSEGKTYSENYHLVSRPDLPDAFPYYAPAQTTISLIDADIPEQHNIGYIMGAGDTIPDDLTSLGFTVHLLTPEDLASGDLKQYDTIVTGVRAYATRADLRDHNQRLLDYVKNGGTFVVQYEQDYNAFNSGHYTPFPATMGRERVSQEEQPVKMLDPESSILRYPNRITNADFDNWVQERGLYFMKEWSPDFTPLLSMNDAGEAPLEGGLLVAHYGKGTYIYTGLSFYRELPNGVPGAARLFINLLAAGHNPAEQPVTNALR